MVYINWTTQNTADGSFYVRGLNLKVLNLI